MSVKHTSPHASPASQDATIMILGSWLAGVKICHVISLAALAQLTGLTLSCD